MSENSSNVPTAGKAAPVKKATARKASTKPAKPAPVTAEPNPFDRAVAFILRDDIEGGYVNDPRDPGGETKFGISKRAYPKLEIAKLTHEDAAAIYRRDYWDKARCDQMPVGIATAVLDCAVNQGVGIAAKLVQKAARVKDDGVIGPVTLAAIHKADQEELLSEFLSWRLRRYAFTGGAATYMRGWAKRILALSNYIQPFEE